MKTNLDQTAQKVKFTSLSKAQMAKIGGGLSGDMTPQERCEYDHVQRCGACDKDGTWTPCG